MSFTAKMIENEIRQMLIDALKKQSKEQGSSLKETQIRFLPDIQNDEIHVSYQALKDYKAVKELSFLDLAGIWKIAFKSVVEGYISQLFFMISEREAIEVENIRIIVQATAAEPTQENLVAHLFDRIKLVRELKVSEFVGGGEEQEEEIIAPVEADAEEENTQNETND